jgi:hypothetical protein
VPKEEYISVRQLLAEVNVLPVENFVVKVAREGKDLVLSPEALSALLKVDTNGRLHGMANTSGQLTEANSGTISTNLAVVRNAIRTMFEAYDAGGTLISATVTPPWQPVPSVVGAGTVITADGAGNIGAAADVVAAVAAVTLDVWAICQVDTTGSYTTKWCEDPTGTPAVTEPDYHTAGHISYLVAGYPYILRVMCNTDAKAFGYDAGVNGNWPNSANMYITGFYRGV